MKNSIRIDELISGLNSGSIQVDFMGHESLLRNDDTPYSPLEELVSSIRMDYEREFNYIKSCEEKGEDIATFKSRTIERDYEFNKDFFIPNHHCSCCGKRLNILPVSDNLVRLFNIMEYEPGTDKGEIKECEAAPLAKEAMLRSEIDISSPELIFFNCFDDNSLNNSESRYSVNNLLGRNKLMQYLAGKNIGYGQMTNTSIAIFAKADGTEVLVSTDMGFDDDGDEYDVEHVGYTKIGMISLDVWRWMCADLETLNSYKVKVKKGLVQKPNKLTKNVRATVKPGRWVIEHYYDFPGENNLIYSKLSLKQEEPAN